MKLLISGSRSITDFDLAPYVPDDVTLILTGGANGVDALAEEYADKHRISKLILRPQYKLYHRGAPLKRNDRMVELCDKVLVIWDGVSRGTKHTIDYANKLDKPVEIVTVS
ncbi:MAG: hypothetical protein IJH94_00365 [Clostridia bacterium]|nr:hypothetical protein [Clostridia bacterium]